MYRNPIIFADYSDPDVIRVGANFYLVSSSFNAVPGLPILRSRDLINWTIIGHALPRIPPYTYYDKVHPGEGVWAPSIRYHEGAFYIYYPDVEYGIYMVKAKNPAGPWSAPILVQAGKGLEDPCPFWDKDGRAYLIHAFAGSRAHIRSVLVMNMMNAEGTKVLDAGVIVYDGHGLDPGIEGPKLYFRGGYYYIFSPAGGVELGWQVVLRSKNIYGPYERRVVLAEGKTAINGPHQGAWVTAEDGQSWFIHFQDRGPYGRVDLLEPMKWLDNWPVIGVNQNRDGVGEPVIEYKMPEAKSGHRLEVPQTSDEFNENTLGLQWQWQANPEATWAYCAGNLGYLRLYARMIPDNLKNYWLVPNLLLQKFPAEEFQATTKVTFTPLLRGDRTGLIVMGRSYAYLSLVERDSGLYLAYATCEHADEGTSEKERIICKAHRTTVYLRLIVAKGATCQFGYSFDGKEFTNAGAAFMAQPGEWVGAKLGIFCTGRIQTNDSGFADFDWFRVTGKK